MPVPGLATLRQPRRARQRSAGFLLQNDQEVQRQFGACKPVSSTIRPVGGRGGRLANRLLATVRGCLDRERAAVGCAPERASSTGSACVCAPPRLDRTLARDRLLRAVAEVCK
jgi:hypothetical protein